MLAQQRKSARAAALMIASLRDKATKTNGSINRVQFNESMVELGVLLSVDEDTGMLFDSLDSDGSGVLNIDELENAVAQLVDPDMVTELETLLREGASVSSSIQVLRDKLSSQAARVIDLFQKWDVNSDGQISQDEFMRAMPLLGLQHCLPIEITGLFNNFDPSGDGKISFRELHKMLRQDPKSPKKKKEEVVEEKVELVDVMQLRKDMKMDVLKMNLKVEIKDLGLPPPYDGDQSWKDHLGTSLGSAGEQQPVLPQSPSFPPPSPPPIR